MAHNLSFQHDGGFEELAKLLDEVGRKFPATTERVLKKEASNIAKDLKKQVQGRVKTHNRRNLKLEEGEKSKKLEDSFRVGKVIRTRNTYRDAVTTSAPHYHLYETGHDQYTHLTKKKNGRKKIGSNRKVGHVEGKKTVTGYMSDRAAYAQLIGEELLNEILKETESYR